MEIIYIVPNGTVKSGGNWITVTRLAEGFKKTGITVDIIEAKDATKENLMRYDVIHVFHVFKSLVKIRNLLMNMNKVLVVSFTGTDLKQLQEVGKNKDEIIGLLNKIDSIVVFHDEAREELAKEGILREKIKIIPQSSMPISSENIHKVQSNTKMNNLDCITFIFAGGIRSVKAPLEMIEMMTSLVEKVRNLRLIIIGPILENELGEQVKEKIKDKDWAKYLGEVSHKETQDFILESDIVINTSISEGMASTLLEAHQMGKPILARDIAGNRAVVTHGVDGYLFKDKEEFEYYATKLSKDSSLREHMGKSGLKARKSYDWKQEITMYQRVYECSCN